MAHKIEVDGITGQEVIIELTAEEVAELENEFLATQAALQAEQEAKESAKASALAKLAALGLTEEEIAAL
jgi:hypothetical protein